MLCWRFVRGLDKPRVPRINRHRTVRRLPPSGRTHRQHLPDAASRCREKIDELTAVFIASTVQQKDYAVPVPFQLAEQQLKSLNNFLDQYCLTMRQELKNREIEESWLSDLEA